MNLLEALEKVGQGRIIGGCTVKGILATVEQAEQIDALLRDPARSAAGMARILNEAGFNISQGTITRHRRGECGCKKS